MKNLSSKFLPTVLVACSMVSVSFGQGTLVINTNAPDITTAPAADLDETGRVFSRIFTEAGNANHARGQIFTLAAGTTEIASLTIQKSSDQTFAAGDSLRLQIFEGTADGFALGLGHTTAAHGNDFFVDTAADINNPAAGPIVPFYDENFALAGVIENEAYITFNFASPISVVGVTDVGFLLTFETGPTTTGTFFQYFENGNGNRTAVSTTAHVGASSRSFLYAMLDTTVAQEVDFLVGDVDLSGLVDFADIGPFISVLSNSQFQLEADIDQNGLVDFADIGPFITLLSGP